MARGLALGSLLTLVACSSALAEEGHEGTGSLPTTVAEAGRLAAQEHVLVPLATAHGRGVTGGRFVGSVMVSPAARAITARPGLPPIRPLEAPENPPSAASVTPNNVPDGALDAGPSLPSAPAPALLFEGIDYGNTGATFTVPDTNGVVGPRNYVQTVNAAFAVWDKSGHQLMAPKPINSLFANLGNDCANAHGDPVVVYDRLADRWLITQFTGGATTPNLQCVAVSQSPDPMGRYWLYAFTDPTAADWGDYPKWAAWSDGYYLSTNEFSSTPNTLAHAQAYVFDRAAMLAGRAPTWWYHAFAPTDTTLVLPANADSATPPPPGGGLFAGMTDDNKQGFTADRIPLWQFNPNWGGTATITHIASLAPAAFDSTLCPSHPGYCVGQPGGQVYLDPSSDRLMFRLAYRNFGDHQSLVFNHTVDRGGDYAAPRWYELRKTGAGPWGIYQQGTWVPDPTERWSGSAAMNGNGDIALGYSMSSSTVYPSIGYAARLASDPLGTLGQGERVLFSGTVASSFVDDKGRGRWGDYSAMTVDPADDCTFWYTQMYWRGGLQDWGTKIAAFRLPNCGPGPSPNPNPNPNPNPQPHPNPAPTPTNILTLSIYPKTFRAAKHGASVAVAVGATVRYRLTQPSTVTFTVSRKVFGRRIGHKCRQVSGHRGARRCSLYKRIGSFSHTSQSNGKGAFGFTGRVGGHKLPPGSYRLTAQPVTPAGLQPDSEYVSFRVRR